MSIWPRYARTIKVLRSTQQMSVEKEVSGVKVEKMNGTNTLPRVLISFIMVVVSLGALVRNPKFWWQ